MKKIKLVMFYICIFCSISCSYEPTGVHHVKVDPNTTIPVMSISMNDPGDTIVVTTRTKLKFNFSTGDKNLNFANVFIDSTSQSITIYNNEMLEFVVDPRNQESGVYDLQILIFTDSQTGSLADLLKVEGFLFARKWVLIIINPDDSVPEILSSEEENGSLKISWKLERDEIISHFRLERSFTSYQWDSVVLGSELLQKFAFDDSYIGERVWYRVIGVTNFGVEIVSDRFLVEKKIPTLGTSEPYSSEAIVIVWDKCMFSNAFKGYRLTLPDGEIVMINDINNRSYSYNMLFGESFKFILTLISNNRDNDYIDEQMQFSTQEYLRNGQPCPFSLPFPVGDYLYYFSNNAMIKYDDQTNQLGDSITNVISTQRTLVSSPKGKYIFVAYPHPKQFSFIESSRTKEAVIRNTREIIGQDVFINLAAVSDNGIVAFERDSLWIYDFEANKLLFVEKDLNYITKMAFTSDGRYLIVNSNSTSYLYEIKDGTVLPKKWIDDEDIFIMQDYAVFPEIPEKIIYRNSKYYTILNLETMVKEVEFEISDDFVNYDMINKHVLSDDRNNFHIYDIYNGNNVKSNLKHKNGLQDYKVRLYGDFIYWNQGYRIKVF